MCSAWELPSELGEAIGAHHDDVEAASCPPAVALVARIRESDDRLGVDELIEAARSRFGLPTDETEQLVRTGPENAAQLAKAFDTRGP